MGSIAGNGVKKCDVGIIPVGHVRAFVDRYLSVEVKLRDVPDMGYTSSDKPFPRGELLVKTREMTTGYYHNEEKRYRAG